LRGDGFARLSLMLDRLGIDLVIITPDEVPEVARLHAADAKLRCLLEPLHQSSGYAVCRVVHERVR
jgi:hypothetical protein